MLQWWGGWFWESGNGVPFGGTDHSVGVTGPLCGWVWQGWAMGTDHSVGVTKPLFGWVWHGWTRGNWSLSRLIFTSKSCVQSVKNPSSNH